MKAQDIIQAARRVVNDADSSLYRSSNQELLEYVNDFQLQLSKAAPSLFIKTEVVQLAAGSLQAVSRLTTNGLAGVWQNADGGFVREIDRESMELQFADWRNHTPGVAQQWSRMEGDVWGFAVYPPSTVNQALTVRTFALPAVLTDVSGDMAVSDVFRAAGAHYVAGRTLFKNTNAADAERGRVLIQTAAVFAGVASLGGQ